MEIKLLQHIQVKFRSLRSISQIILHEAENLKEMVKFIIKYQLRQINSGNINKFVTQMPFHINFHPYTQSVQRHHSELRNWCFRYFCASVIRSLVCKRIASSIASQVCRNLWELWVMGRMSYQSDSIYWPSLFEAYGLDSPKTDIDSSFNL